MADKIGIYVTQIKRYEAGEAQPTLQVFRKIVLALNVSADTMLFDGDESGPDDELRLMRPFSNKELKKRLDPRATR